ncbi:MAG: hypothetical protein M1819_001790 [Sarea resinae]|nr:MAG: hypothetical protein M1819_001790 [Sarea resinae]
MAGKGMTIPPRKGPSGFPSSIDSPSGTFNSLWSTMGNPDKTGIPSSVGSVNMLDTDSASSDSDQDELLDPNDYDDPILTTPQVYRLGNSVTPLNSASPFTTGANSLPGENLATFSPAAASLMSFQRARFRGARSRKSSSSASGQSSMASPSPKSPPLTKSTESTAGGYFARELARKNSEPRRESLTFGTNELHISGGAEWEECLQAGAGPGSNSIAASQSNDEKRGVIRRPVTRRGNLLPQTKNFARIRAALMEESAPVDSDVKRESEVIRQVRESEPDLEPAHHPCQPTMDDHSPHLIPMVPGIPDALEGIPEDEIMSGDNAARTHDTERTDNFTRQAMKNSGGLEFWNSFDAQKRTPPPSLRRDSQWGLNDDISMESPAGSVAPSSQMIFPSPQQQTSKPTSRSSTPQPCAFPSAADMNRKVSKRRRDDDFSINSLKRRAVSPGVSVQSSPVMTHSPGQREGLWGSLSRSGRELVPPAPGAHGIGERANSASSANSSVVGPTVKRVGFQGMSDTNDGLMNMSIE